MDSSSLFSLLLPPEAVRELEPLAFRDAIEGGDISGVLLSLKGVRGGSDVKETPFPLAYAIEGDDDTRGLLLSFRGLSEGGDIKYELLPVEDEINGDGAKATLLLFSGLSEGGDIKTVFDNDVEETFSNEPFRLALPHSLNDILLSFDSDNSFLEV